jgi:hypothetical protein
MAADPEAISEFSNEACETAEEAANEEGDPMGMVGTFNTEWVKAMMAFINDSPNKAHVVAFRTSGGDTAHSTE